MQFKNRDHDLNKRKIIVLRNYLLFNLKKFNIILI